MLRGVLLLMILELIVGICGGLSLRSVSRDYGKIIHTAVPLLKQVREVTLDISTAQRYCADILLVSQTREVSAMKAIIENLLAHTTEHLNGIEKQLMTQKKLERPFHQLKASTLSYSNVCRPFLTLVSVSQNDEAVAFSASLRQAFEKFELAQCALAEATISQVAKNRNAVSQRSSLWQRVLLGLTLGPPILVCIIVGLLVCVLLALCRPIDDLRP